MVGLRLAVAFSSQNVNQQNIKNFYEKGLGLFQIPFLLSHVESLLLIIMTGLLKKGTLYVRTI